MRVLTADPSLPTRRQRPVAFSDKARAGEFVMAFAEGGVWAYHGLETRGACGTAARVEERDVSPREVAALALPGLPSATVEDFAQVYLQAMAWLQDLPVGAYVTISRGGLERMPLPQAAVSLEWLVADGAEWAERQAAEGRIAAVVRQPDGWKLAAVPMAGPVDLENLVSLFRQFKGTEEAEEVRPFTLASGVR